MSRGNARKHPADILVDYRRLLVGLVAFLSVLAAVAVPSLEKDPSLTSMFSVTSPKYRQHQDFLKIFGNDEFIILAIKNKITARDPGMLTALDSLTKKLTKMDKVAEVVSITNLECFRKVGGEVGNYPLVLRNNESLVFPADPDLDEMRKALPVMDLLLSPDLKTLGVLIRVHDRWRMDLDAFHELVASINDSIKGTILADSDYRIVGAAMIRNALEKYSIQSAVIFGLLCGLICTVVTVYIFRSLKVTLVTGLILSLSLLWTLGLMSVLRIPLNPTTSTAFGLILITSLEIVIHMVVRYNQFRQLTKDRIDAVRETVRFLARPCLICAATTAVGFGSCMVSSIPMVFQLGLIMSLGIMISCGLALILASALIIATTALDADARFGIAGGLLTGLLEKVKQSISKHYRIYTVGGFAIAALMFSGTPFIRTDQQFLRFLGETNTEVRDIRFVEENLTGFHVAELILESEGSAFKKAAAWNKVMELEERLRDVPGVVATDSLLPFLVHAHSLLGRQTSSPLELFRNPALVPQLLFLTSMTPEGKRMMRRYAQDDFSRIRILVRFKNSASTSIQDTVAQIRSIADSVMKGVATPTVTGELAVFSAQGVDFVTSEIHSLLLALAIITILLMIQMGTPLFGLVSLIPNIPPIAAVFGVMGWFGICLDGATVFAATVAVGLAVDNTIHYVAQLKREIRLNPGLGVRACVFRAYSFAAPPMAAWSVVTLLGFLTLLATPFRATHNFGILVSAAVLMGMFGDLAFMQSMVLTSASIRRLIRKVIDKDNHSRNLREETGAPRG